MLQLEDYCNAFQKKLTVNDLFRIKMMPLEELTDRNFHQKFPINIYPYPLGSGYVIPADWFDGTIYIKDESSDYFAPYQRLTFEAGKLVSIQNIIYYEWENIKKSKEKNSLPQYLKRPD